MKDYLSVERAAEGGSADAPNVATADARRLANASLSLTLSQNRLITILAVGSREEDGVTNAVEAFHRHLSLHQ